ncbi:MAG TPA: hypothetical protein VGD57_09245 [Candidatus Dormibacteraeota bacterium]|jgi:hypothetical protein
MPKQLKTKEIIAAPADAIRIVPLKQADERVGLAGARRKAPTAQLTYRGGPLLQKAEVFTVFWGAAWNQAANKTLAKNLNAFFDTILKSSLIAQLKEYNVGSQSIGNGRRTGTTTVTTPKPARAVSDATIRHLLQQEITTNKAFPAPTPNTLYFVYLPPGTTVSMGGSRSCLNFCGYHDNINGQIFYAVMPYAGCNGCLGGLSALDALTATSSHELCEAITDAIPGQGWYDDQNGEIGDICAWKFKKVGKYNVQQEWSNKVGGCV